MRTKLKGNSLLSLGAKYFLKEQSFVVRIYHESEGGIEIDLNGIQKIIFSGLTFF